MKRCRLNSLGRKGLENQRVCREKKAEHIKNGIQWCELKLSPYCTPLENLTWSHSMKRRFMGKMGTEEREFNMRESVVGCRNCHRIADEEMSHADMLELHKRIIASRDTEQAA